jgi:hypothetical protein
MQFRAWMMGTEVMASVCGRILRWWAIRWTLLRGPMHGAPIGQSKKNPKRISFHGVWIG